MTVRMRHTKGHTANRRSHHGLKGPRLSVCQECGSQHLRHTMCDTCGNYRGKQVVDMKAKVEKRMERIAAKRRSQGLEDEE